MGNGFRDPGKHRANGQVGNSGDWDAEDYRANKEWLGGGEDTRPAKSGMKVNVSEVQLRREMVWVAQAPVAELVFRPQQDRYKRQQHVMHGHAKERRQLTAPEKRREQQREQRLEPKQGRKAEEDAEGKSERH
jgi:hypothetical protein